MILKSIIATTFQIEKLVCDSELTGKHDGNLKIAVLALPLDWKISGQSAKFVLGIFYVLIHQASMSLLKLFSMEHALP